MATKSTRKSAAKKTAAPGEPEQAARNRANAARRASGKADTTRNHDANPDVSTDSSVRHAEPQTGKQRGEGAGGYPSGEYDVTKPAGEDVKTKGATALAAHLELAPESEAAVKRAKAYAILEPDQFDQAVEALPVGTVIEHEGPNRWRVHVTGQNRWGHGATHSEAVEHYVTGIDQTTAQTEADARLAALPKRQQQEIVERDQKAAAAVGAPAPDTERRIAQAKESGVAIPRSAEPKGSGKDEVAGTEGKQA